MDPEIHNTYNAVGLIGGEFFGGQLNGIEKEWFDLIRNVKSLLHWHSIKEFWLATALLFEDTYLLDRTLDALDIHLLDSQVVRICTSYDTIGRFLTKEREDIWFNNVKHIKEKFPKLQIHTQTILTQDTMEKLIDNPDYFDFITEYSSIDFRYPSITRKDCPTVTGVKDYRAKVLERSKEFPKKFFIENRSVFLKFLKVFHDKYGLQKVKDMLNQPEMRSRRLKIYVENNEIEDRWNDTRDIYSECGHLVDGKCYIDSDKCLYCDLERFIKNMENV